MLYLALTALALPNPAAETPLKLLQPDEAIKPWRVHIHIPHGHRPHRHSPHWHVPTCSCPNNAKASSSVVNKGIEDVIAMVAVYDLELIAQGGTVPNSVKNKKEHMTGMKTAELIAHPTLGFHHHMNISLVEGASALHASIQSDANALRRQWSQISGKAASNGAYGATWKYGGVTYVGYAGTDFTDTGDIAADLNSAFTVAFEGASAGSGFKDHYAAVYDDVISPAKAMTSSGGSIRVIGHSLGGGIGNLAALELKNDGYSVHLATAGCPRAFSSGTIGTVASKGITTTRWTNYNDPVPMLPPSVMGFTHLGDALYINFPSGSWCVGCTPCSIEATIKGNDFSAEAGVCSVPGTGHLSSSYIERMRAI